MVLYHDKVKEKAKVHKIRFNLLFGAEQLGRAEEALDFYAGVFNRG
ncbi:hypothetical protein ACF3NG_00470 [Aerococcaceae bacterium WGS1372]